MMRERGGGESPAIPRGLWYVRDSSLRAPGLEYLGSTGSEGAPRQETRVPERCEDKGANGAGNRRVGVWTRCWHQGLEDDKKESGCFSCELEHGAGKKASVTKTSQKKGPQSRGEQGREGEWLWPLNATKKGRGVALGNWAPWGTSKVCRTRLTVGGSRRPHLGPAPDFGTLLPTPQPRPTPLPVSLATTLAGPLLEALRHAPIGCQTTSNPNPRSSYLGVRPALIFAYRAF